MKRALAVLLYITLAGALLAWLCTPIVLAAPSRQSTPPAAAPTDEPPKPPYVFPTPIFIPTYPGDTPVPVAPRSTGQPTGQDTYTVQGGDSLWTIAQKVYGDGTKYPLIMSANGLTSTTRLRVGTVLKIPAIAGALPAPTSTPAASTPIAPAPQPTTLPSASPTVTAAPAIPTPITTSRLPGSVAEVIAAGINIVAGILALAGFIAAILALLVYYRARRMEGQNTKKNRLQIRM